MDLWFAGTVTLLGPWREEYGEHEFDDRAFLQVRE